MRLLVIGCAFLIACEEPPVTVEDVTWDPPLTDASSGELDFGEVPQTQEPQAGIFGRNNTDAEMVFAVDCGGLSASGGFLVTCPIEQAVPADPDGPPSEDGTEGLELGGQVTASFMFVAAGATDYQGTVQFTRDNHIITYIVRATRLP